MPLNRKVEHLKRETDSTSCIQIEQKNKKECGRKGKLVVTRVLLLSSVKHEYHVYSKFGANASGRFRDISLDKRKLGPAGRIRWKI